MTFVVLIPMGNKNIIITEGGRPLWQTLLAAACYTLALLLLATFFFGYELFPKTGIDNRWNVKLCYSAIICAAQGVVFSSVKSIYFNLKDNTFKKEYSVGPIKVGSWKKLPNVAYVSVFRQLKKDGSHTYEVNLWLTGNKSFTVYESSHMESTFAMGKNTASSLKVNLLDARVPNNYKWIKNQD